MEDRVIALESISGLKVQYRIEKGQYYFEFFHKGSCVNGFFSYPKARAFAQGVATGKTIAQEKQ